MRNATVAQILLHYAKIMRGLAEETSAEGAARLIVAAERAEALVLVLGGLP